MNKAERFKLSNMLKFNRSVYEEKKRIVESAPYNFNAYAEMRYYEGLIVGLMMMLGEKK